MATTYALISSNVLGTTAATVTFSSIPATYTDLFLSFSVRSNTASTADSIQLTFNGNTTSLYSRVSLQGDGATAGTSDQSNTTFINLQNIVNGATSTTNTFGSGEIYIPSYLTSQDKAVGSYAAQENNTSTAFLRIQAALFRSTSTISSITLTISGASFVANSSFYLYGIKNS